jgi:putative hydrolase of the HAD superfamily
MLYTHRALEMRVATVILDFGGVLGLPQDSVRAATMASLCGLGIQEFHSVYLRDRLELDRGTLATEEYWRRILAAGGVEPSPELIARIEREDALGWTRVNQRVVRWCAELRRAGYRTAILSNMPTDKLSFMRDSGRFAWIGEFDMAVFSCEHALVKPEQEFYQRCLDLLGAAPRECVFLDDSAVNVEAARAIGIGAMVFRSAEEAAVELERKWGLPVSSLVDGTHG